MYVNTVGKKAKANPANANSPKNRTTVALIVFFWVSYIYSMTFPFVWDSKNEVWKPENCSKANLLKHLRIEPFHDDSLSVNQHNICSLISLVALAWILYVCVCS